MEGLSFWSAQALQNLDCNGPLKVIYYQSRQEVIEDLLDGPAGEVSNAEEVSFPGDERTYTTNDPNKEYDSRRDVMHMSMSVSMPGSMPASMPMSMLENHGFFSNLMGKIFTIENFLDEKYPQWREFGHMPKPPSTSSKPIPEKLKVAQNTADLVDKYNPFTGTDPPPWSIGDPPTSTTTDPYENAFPVASEYKYALVFGNTTEINPCGIWVVEEFYTNDNK